MGGLKFDFHTGQRAAGARVAVAARAKAGVVGADAVAEEARVGGAGDRVASSSPPSY